MSRTLFSSGVILIVFLLTACGGSGPSDSANSDQAPAIDNDADAVVGEAPDLADIAAGDHRSAENRARNASRHPVETLKFLGLRPSSRVMEIWPSGGWYTEVIAPYVNESGKYYAAHWDPESEIEFVRNGVQRFKEKLAERPDLYGNVEMAVLMPPDLLSPVAPESVDLVLTFRNIHNWMGRNVDDEIFKVMYDALKPGGVLGVVEHRGNPNVPQDPKAASGYVNQDYAIKLAEKAGFALVDTSEINANPADTKDYEKGVWTLPPTFRAGDENKEKFAEIGESDRFTLKFVKPLKGR